MGNKQTAVEWFQEKFDKYVRWCEGHHAASEYTLTDLYQDLQQAKEMEKERIETAYNKGTVHGIDYPESTLPLTGKQYFTETYE
jgi:hypothetical protein